MKKLSPESIKQHMKYQHPVHFFGSVTSTNAIAADMAADGAPHGTVIFACSQTNGRGRLGRQFASPDSGIYMSVILKQEEVSPLMVTTAAAVAVCRAIEEVCGKQPEIKWVNDIYLNGKKVCGILAEAVTDHRTGQITHIIAGIGINCDPSAIPDELADIAGAIDGDFSTSRLAAHVLNNLLELTESQDTESVISSYRDLSMVLGKTVTVYKGGYSPEAAGLRARILDIAGDGGLVVLYSDGSQEKLSTGEISIRL